MVQMRRSHVLRRLEHSVGQFHLSSGAQHRRIYSLYARLQRSVDRVAVPSVIL